MSRTTIMSLTHIGTGVPWDEAFPLIEQRLLSRLKQNGSCWEYQGCRNDWGYGMLDVQRRRWMSHRLAYTLWSGPIPEGMDILHSCDNPACCYPLHLRPGTQLENSLEMVAKGRTDAQKRTHCTRGHDYEIYGVRHGKNQWRNCAICTRGRLRLKAGWPEKLAFSVDPVPNGFRPVNGTWKR